jgi:NADPH:quinone reductase-like Zn-dependent oxidoreductase
MPPPQAPSTQRHYHPGKSPALQARLIPASAFPSAILLSPSDAPQALEISPKKQVRSTLTGRNQASPTPLAELGADLAIPLDQEPEKLTKAFHHTIKEHGVNVILDYLWGASAQSLMNAVTGHELAGGEPPIRFVQIGSITGEAIFLPAASLRSSGLKLMCSGLGSVSYAELIRSISGLMIAIVPGRFHIEAEAVPLSEVETAWTRDATGRIAFIS